MLPSHYAKDSGCSRHLLSVHGETPAKQQVQEDPARPWMDTLLTSVLSRYRGTSRTFEVEMGRPIAFDMGNDTLATAVETGVILYADSRAGGVQIVECSR